MRARPLFALAAAVWVSGALLTGATPAAADPGAGSDQARDAQCAVRKRVLVPGAQRAEVSCLTDLTTAGTTVSGHTDPADWAGLNAPGTINPVGVPGIQIDGYFPDTSTSNTWRGWNHDSQFVMRFPDNWNGKLVIAGPPGNRRQFSSDFIISDWVLARGYAYASTDKGNTGTTFYRDGDRPGDAVAEWHLRVAQVALVAKWVTKQVYGKLPARTYMTGISNGGYLTRWQLENNPWLFDGGVDWEGTLFTADGPNLLTTLPAALRDYPAAAAGDEAAARRMDEAGFSPQSRFLWQLHYQVYWDLTQRVYREEFDPDYDGDTEAGYPFCAPGSVVGCDADYDYASRPPQVRRAVARISLTGRITKPMITLHGDLDTLLPIRATSDVYARMIAEADRDRLHRYYRIPGGNHVDGFLPLFPDRLRPILPCQRSAFVALEDWVERGTQPPANGQVQPEPGDPVNTCRLPA